MKIAKCKITLTVIVLLSVSILVSIGVFIKQSHHNVLAKTVDTNGVFTIPESTGELGSNDNPFVVL